MKKEEIKINSIYAMKVGKNTVGIRIMSQNKDGHWVGINVNTNKEVLIKSADRLCGLYNPKAAKQSHTSGHVATKGKQPGKDTTKPNGGKQGGLSGAVRVLQEAGKPVNCKDIVQIMLDKGYWKTGGKTPAATIYSAIIREIKEKGADSRFRKAERGKFTLAK